MDGRSEHPCSVCGRGAAQVGDFFAVSLGTISAEGRARGTSGPRICHECITQGVEALAGRPSTFRIIPGPRVCDLCLRDRPIHSDDSRLLIAGNVVACADCVTSAHELLGDELGQAWAPPKVYDYEIEPGEPGTTFANPARHVSRYFGAARRLATRTRQADESSQRRELAFLTILAAAAAAEAFANVWFANLARDRRWEHLSEGVREDLDRRRPIADRLREWPTRFFDKTIHTDAARAFAGLLALRDRLLLLEPSFHAVESPDLDLQLDGLLHVAHYCALGPKDADEAIRAAEDLVVALGALEPSPADADHMLASWTGKSLPAVREPAWEEIASAVGVDVELLRRLRREFEET